MKGQLYIIWRLLCTVWTRTRHTAAERAEQLFFKAFYGSWMLLFCWKRALHPINPTRGSDCWTPAGGKPPDPFAFSPNSEVAIQPWILPLSWTCTWCTCTSNMCKAYKQWTEYYTAKKCSRQFSVVGFFQPRIHTMPLCQAVSTDFGGAIITKYKGQRHGYLAKGDIWGAILNHPGHCNIEGRPLEQMWTSLGKASCMSCKARQHQRWWWWQRWTLQWHKRPFTKTW